MTQRIPRGKVHRAVYRAQWRIVALIVGAIVILAIADGLTSAIVGHLLDVPFEWRVAELGRWLA